MSEISKIKGYNKILIPCNIPLQILISYEIYNFKYTKKKLGKSKNRTKKEKVTPFTKKYFFILQE